MRILLLALPLAGCALAQHENPPPPPVLDTVWAASIHPGDMFVLVPGTGSYGLLAQPIDKLAGDNPDVDVHAMHSVAEDAIVFESAIAAAHRAGIADHMLEDGTITFGMWGAGFAAKTQFTYVSYEGLRVPIHILGGTSKCAVGSVPDNLFNYNGTNANADAVDLYQRIQMFVTDHPSVSARNITVASHSWGGAGAEYLAFEKDTIAADNGPLPNATINFTIAMGVPGFVPGYTFAGPSLKDVRDGHLYEVDRPDDPVHMLSPSGNGAGHQYNIVIDGTFVGSYGVTTEELACDGVAGECTTDQGT